ncbi:MAG: ImmA/IrrE family metallo-endopeptidase [Acidobacteriota bacterium]|nr:ImmA/IrrE family metallo-endopeptidase [Acidobacteriota bacterium]
MSDPLIQKFCDRWGIKFPEEAIKKAIRFTFPNLQEVKLPVDVKRLAYERGVLQIRSTAMQADGIISLKDGGGYLIDVNKSHPENRRRFTIAHEIGHTFFFDLESDLTTRLRLQVADTNLTDIKANRYEEYLCNLAAAEILMPSKPFSTNVQSAGPTAKTIITLSRLFKTSIWATSRRLIEVCPFPKLLVALWEYQPAYGIYQTSWVVQSAKNRGSQKLTVDERSPIFSTFQSMSSFRGRKLISLGGDIDDYFVDGCIIKNTSPKTILTVFILHGAAGNFFSNAKEISVSSDQMKLFN